MRLRWAIAILVAAALAAAVTAATPRQAAALSAKDQQIKQGVLLLRGYIDRQAASNGFTYPTKGQVKKGGGLVAPVWPLDPYTGKPMAPGSSRGTYTYTPAADGHGYTLTAHLSTGSYKVTGSVPLRIKTERDAATQSNILLLQGYVEAWTTLHGGTTLPPAWDVAPSGIGADLNVAWPVNPWTGRPMSAGAGAGDYVYVTSYQEYDLGGVRSDGTDFAVSGQAGPSAIPNSWACMRAQWQDELVKQNIDRLDQAIRADARRNGALPEPQTVAAWRSSWGQDWPDNPFTGMGMSEGAAPGDYSYITGTDGSYTLRGHRSIGDYTVSLGPTKWDSLNGVIISGVEAIGNAIERYALDNNNVYPSPAEVSVNGAIGTLVLQWPDDPLSGGYMANTGARGGFSYSVSADLTSYSLNAELVGGDEFDVGQWTSALWEPLLGLRDRFKDHIAQAGLQVISDYVDVWRLTHADALPSAGDLSAGGAVGADHAWWPTNPWTGTAMAAGTGRGDFQYVPAAGGYTLTVREAPFLEPMYGGAYPEYYAAQ